MARHDGHGEGLERDLDREFAEIVLDEAFVAAATLRERDLQSPHVVVVEPAPCPDCLRARRRRCCADIASVVGAVAAVATGAVVIASAILGG